MAHAGETTRLEHLLRWILLMRAREAIIVTALIVKVQLCILLVAATCIIGCHLILTHENVLMWVRSAIFVFLVVAKSGWTLEIQQLMDRVSGSIITHFVCVLIGIKIVKRVVAFGALIVLLLLILH